MNIILDPSVSEIEDGLELEEIKEAVGDGGRYQVENTPGSYTVIGSTEDDQQRVITAIIKKRERVWVVLKAHRATEEEKQTREEATRRSS